jgi:acetyltransferase-like isoleucine patch superfamily enzyme
MNMVRGIRSYFLAWYFRLRGARVGENFQAAGPVEILLRDGASFRNLKIGNNVTFGGKVYIRIRKNGRITLDDNVRTGTEVWLVTGNDAELSVGKNAILNSYSIFNGGHGLKIGSYCIFAAFVYINTSDHGFRRGELIQKQGFFGAPVEIGDDVWLGGHVFVSKGVRIGKGAVVGAGAVVTDDIPEEAIAVGIPARVVRQRE